jgi:hypothetical protein
VETLAADERKAEMQALRFALVQLLAPESGGWLCKGDLGNGFLLEVSSFSEPSQQRPGRCHQQ